MLRHHFLKNLNPAALRPICWFAKTASGNSKSNENIAHSVAFAAASTRSICMSVHGHGRSHIISNSSSHQFRPMATIRPSNLNNVDLTKREHMAEDAWIRSKEKEGRSQARSDALADGGMISNSKAKTPAAATGDPTRVSNVDKFSEGRDRARGEPRRTRNDVDLTPAAASAGAATNRYLTSLDVGDAEAFIADSYANDGGGAVEKVPSASSVRDGDLSSPAAGEVDAMSRPGVFPPPRGILIHIVDDASVSKEHIEEESRDALHRILEFHSIVGPHNSLVESLMAWKHTTV